ncbi:MAG: hypothetical protein GX458_05135 [Phyllobacteriaceae bacterium]|nr:hypothetical protein [Phyllobacteriaceae bacterium]
MTLVRRPRVRRLGDEERRLWEKVVETVEPLHGEAANRRVDAESIAPESNAAAPAVPAPSMPAPPVEPPRPPRIVRPTGPTRHPLVAPPGVIHVKHAERADGLPPAVKAPPSLARIDPRTKRRLVRGVLPIDDRLDLHGYTEAAAHALLRGFLIGARAHGARVVLVITGKGAGPGKEHRAPHERGVLRRAVPHWLADPTLRDVVLGFEEAHLAHGGAGAIYVRLRRAGGRGGEGGR